MNILILGMTEFFIILFIVLAYMIKYKGRIEITSGFDAARVKDRKGLAGFIGNNLIVLAICAIFTFIIELTNPSLDFLAFIIFASMIVPIVGIYTFIGSRRFLK